MTAVYIHLVLCHIPIVLVPLAVGIVVAGLLLKKISIRRVGYSLFFLAGLIAIPVFLTGEPAEEQIEHIPTVLEYRIKAHEEMAEISVWASTLLGFFALGLFLLGEKKLEKKGSFLIILIGIIVSGQLAYTGNLGGKIRHTEIAGNALPEQQSSQGLDKE